LNFTKLSEFVKYLAAKVHGNLATWVTLGVIDSGRFKGAGRLKEVEVTEKPSSGL